MKIVRNLAFGVLFLTGTVALFARPQSLSTSAQSHSSSKSGAARTADNREGERKFQENCGRCHTEPQAISPRETKAVMQHMRVRASLSAEDAELIRRFLAP
jgi:cytochrome c5